MWQFLFKGKSVTSVNLWQIFCLKGNIIMKWFRKTYALMGEIRNDLEK